MRKKVFNSSATGELSNVLLIVLIEFPSRRIFCNDVIYPSEGGKFVKQLLERSRTFKFRNK